ncbi:MAG: signal peptidase I [Polyangiaceae bacterium]
MSEEVSPPPPNPEDMTSPAPLKRSSPVLRYLYFAVLLVALPASLAVLTVRLLKPDSAFEQVGVLRTFVAEQQVPGAIVFFTAFALLLWRLRYMLPFATRAGVLGRPDLPRDMCVKYDQAQHLIEEARRVMRVNERAVARGLKPSEREAVDEAIADLEETMYAVSFHAEDFAEAAHHLDDLVDSYLSRWRKSEVREYGESIGIAFAVAIALRIFVVEAFKIPSGSMVPTLMIGDHIFVAKYAYGPLLPRSDTRLFSQMPPERGDVLVFKFPEKKEQDFIKRVVALPGDRLEALDGRPVINGFLIPNCYVGRVNVDSTVRGHLYLEYIGAKNLLTMYNDRRPQIACKRQRDCGGARSCRGGICGMVQGPFRVPEKQIYVMGDNRNNSHDSRFWRGGMGAGVPFENIKGRALFVWWAGTHRIFVDVMGEPKLPKGAGPKLHERLRACLKNRPPVSETTPPPPKDSPAAR